MSNANPAEERINKYLNDVASHLNSVSKDERDEIISSIRAHIDNELQIRGEGQTTLEDVEEVLLDMGPPASYLESATSL